MDARSELELQLADLKVEFIGNIDKRLAEITLIVHKDGEALRETPVTPKKKNQSPTKNEKEKSETEKRQEKVEQNRAKQNAKHVLVKGADPSKIITNDNSVTKALKEILNNLKLVNLDSQSLRDYLTLLEDQQKKLDFDRTKDAAQTPLPSLQLVINQINAVKNLLDQTNRLEEEEDARQINLALQEARRETAETIRSLDEKAEKQRQEKLKELEAKKNREEDEAAKLRKQKPTDERPGDDHKVEAESAADMIFGTPSSFQPIKKSNPQSNIVVAVISTTTYVAGDQNNQQSTVPTAESTSQPEDVTERYLAAAKFMAYADQLIKTDWRWWAAFLNLFGAETTQQYKARNLKTLATQIKDKETNATYIQKITEAKEDKRLIKGFFFSHNTKNLLTNAENGEAAKYISEPVKVKKV